ncbi:protein-L-isoaspartate(D-aspartate) O-methyltransferase [Thauera sp. CAU 1555]|uniref:Protein-L-isoaspartate O-methyltransferase n=1 Tax=Thauera sedimentorum TaxID=2767595 RepID=A0ABR9B6M8_9RHOO|nr:protein-L-isoaspartate(D-aspartate) O-methyltransferase [Thauera sedimentorum]MBC9070734.1 protein-L-isoaspartate(D-aspartate) O-methyltransferase [Thauera sedimentorum]MBD8501653.1 protein-L-isoaspartate(D-aspartate) O-methyltransferase [Thauera sedimentorum]
MNMPLADAGRAAMRARARMVERLRTQGVRDEKVLAAMMQVPRHQFVQEGLAYSAYDDTALPIGFQQTISQPFVVARMIELLRAGRELGRTLEVGAGCGYQAAVLSFVAAEVYAVERIRPLLDRARENLRTLRRPNVRLKHADGNLGLPEAAPFDTIIVAAAAPSVPQALKEQLAPGGRLMIPVGTGDQRLVLVERQGGTFRESRLEAVRFVPLLTGTE